MTPPQLDPNRVHAKLATMREILDELDDLQGLTFEQLTKDRRTRAAVERFISQLVDLAVDINAHVVAARLDKAASNYRETFKLSADAGAITHELADQLAPSVGMRNVIVHEYLDLDLVRLAEAIPIAAMQYREYLRQIATYVTATPSGTAATRGRRPPPP